VRVIERRIGLLFACFLILFLLTLTRAIWVQGVRGGGLSAEAKGQQTEILRIPGQRGRILDRNGKELAVSEDASDIIATPYQVNDPVKAAKKLAPVLRVPGDRLLEKLSNRESGFAYLRRQAPGSVADRVRRLDLDGIDFLPASRRLYPQGYMASQVIGTVGVEGKGLSGLENAHDSTLKGEDGARRVLKDALGEPLRLQTSNPAHRGDALRLTLDAALQGRTEQVLSEIGQTYRPRGATVIVLDPRNGEVLAMANWPRVDANDVGGAPASALTNRATGTNYEPGSTFKAFTVAGALSEKVVTPDTTFPLGDTIQVADRTINNAEPGEGGNLTVAQILARSSNVGAVTIGLKLGKQRFDHWIRRFGFGERTGIDFPGEERGIVPSLPDYSGSTMGNLPIGQGISVTPIQMATAYSAIANGGILRPAHLIKSVNGRQVGRTRGRRVLSRGVARQVRHMLEGVLAAGGTASEVKVPGYKLAGKTGTAQKAENGGYSESKFVASFIGFAPARDPRLLVGIMVDEPKGAIYGGVVAAPAFGKIVTFALPHLGIRPQ
jgi:cell division protein FtsI (penicillin-binding protein 3)